MRSVIILAAFAAAAPVLSAQAPPFIYDHQVHVDGSCRIFVQPQPGDDSAKPKTKKNKAICEMTKDKDTTAPMSIMFQGVPRKINVNIREMAFLLQNPTEDTVHFTLTYALRQGHRIDPNGGRHPDKVTPTEATYELDIKPGQNVPLDVAERDH